MRFTNLGRQVPGISQKLLTQARCTTGRDGLVTRTVHSVIPPSIDYKLTDLGLSLAEAFCGVWQWAKHNLRRIEATRRQFDARPLTHDLPNL